MAPREKTTPEQKVHLMARMDEYLEARKHNALTRFWSIIFQSWWSLWPAQEDMSIENPEERRVAHARAIEKQEEVSGRIQASSTTLTYPFLVHQGLVPKPQLTGEGPVTCFWHH